MSNALAITLTIGVLCFDVLLLLAILTTRLARGLQERRERLLEKRLLEQLQYETLHLDAFKTKDLLRLFSRISPALRFNEALELQFLNHLTDTSYMKKIGKRLRGFSVLGRIEAAAKLRNFAKIPEIKETLLDALKQEKKNPVVILYLFQALARIGEKKKQFPSCSGNSITPLPGWLDATAPSCWDTRVSCFPISLNG